MTIQIQENTYSKTSLRWKKKDEMFLKGKFF